MIFQRPGPLVRGEYEDKIADLEERFEKFDMKAEMEARPEVM
jgi:hypothetical protein